MNRRTRIAAGALALLLAGGCSVDSYLSDPSDVQCDGRRTQVELPSTGTVAFIVHGKNKGEVATLDVRHNSDGVSVKVTGDVTGPPQELEADGYTKPLPIEDKTSFGTFGAGGAWVLTVDSEHVTILGSCEGM